MRGGERLELDAAPRVEPLDRVDEAEHPGADEVARIDARRQAGADTTGDELHQRRVVHDEVLARGGLRRFSQRVHCICRSGSSGTMLMLADVTRGRQPTTAPG
jgi:hypothetical protein